MRFYTVLVIVTVMIASSNTQHHYTDNLTPVDVPDPITDQSSPTLSSNVSRYYLSGYGTDIAGDEGELLRQLRVMVMTRIQSQRSLVRAVARFRTETNVAIDTVASKVAVWSKSAYNFIYFFNS